MAMTGEWYPSLRRPLPTLAPTWPVRVIAIHYGVRRQVGRRGTLTGLQMLLEDMAASRVPQVELQASDGRIIARFSLAEIDTIVQNYEYLSGIVK